VKEQKRVMESRELYKEKEKEERGGREEIE